MTGLFFGFTLRNGTLVPDEGVTVNAKKLKKVACYGLVKSRKRVDQKDASTIG